MVSVKTNDEIAVMQEAGKRLRKVMKEIMPLLRPGITTNHIDQEAEKFIRRFGGEPGFKRVYGYKWATCLSINQQAVHTPPSETTLKSGDVITLDIGFYYGGFHTDHAISVLVGSSDKLISKFLATGKNALMKAIAKAKPNAYIGEISQTIYEEITSAGFYVLKELTGHGIGRQLHEAPMIPGFPQKDIKKTHRLKPGNVIAVEVIYSTGTEKVKHEVSDPWSIKTDDESLAACFEHTVAISTNGAQILT